MNFEEFKQSLSETSPPSGLNAMLEALWHDAAGNWKQAHQIVQDISSCEAAWIHAYLHRKEGDLSNATYWYGRAGQPVCRTSLEEEWQTIARSLLNAS